MKTHLVTKSGPGRVRIEMHSAQGMAWAEESPMGALVSAYAIADSAARAAQKAGNPFPAHVLQAIAALRGAAA